MVHTIVTVTTLLELKLAELTYVLVAVGSSGILKAKQKLGVTFNSDKLGSINFTKFSKLTMCMQCLGGSPGHHFSKNLVCKV